MRYRPRCRAAVFCSVHALGHLELGRLERLRVGRTATHTFRVTGSGAAGPFRATVALDALDEVAVGDMRVRARFAAVRHDAAGRVSHVAGEGVRWLAQADELLVGYDPGIDLG